MKNLLILLLSGVFFSHLMGPLNAQVFVKSDAVGANDGSSWTNAYTDLQYAIDNRAGDQLWIASGTWYPTNAGNPNEASFQVMADIQLFGGFAGTENSLSERDIEANPTILSGDLNGDDVPNDFTMNRSDNVRHILRIGTEISNATIIDGFTFIGGHADGSTIPTERGAGIYNEGLPIIRHCTFTQNYAERATAVHNYLNQVNPSDTLKIEDCLFLKNYAIVTGSGLLHVSFTPNQNLLLKNLQFVEGWGSAVHILFRDNNSSAIVENCLFDSQVISGNGGGMIYRTNDEGCSLLVSDCEFIDNATAAEGGGLKCLLAPGGDNSSTLIENCSFSNNTASSSGGGLYIHFENYNNTFEVRQCSFDNNRVEGPLLEYYGGAISVESFESSLNAKLIIENCSFNENYSQSGAGAIDLWNVGTGFEVEILNSQFKANDALDYGLAISTEGDPEDSEGLLKIQNCLFTEHNYDELAVINNNGNFNIAIYNSTLADNQAVGVAVASTTVDLTFKNSIFHNPNGLNFEGPFPSVSLGGNLLTDDSAIDFLVFSDQIVDDPFFTGTGDHPYQLSEISTAINQGILNGEEAEFDLAGNVRVQNDCIDVGAYESPYGPNCSTVSIDPALISNNKITVFPNPVHSTTTIELSNTWRDDLQLNLVDLLGQMVQSHELYKGSDTVNITIELTHLESGIYHLILFNGEERLKRKIVKL